VLVQVLRDPGSSALVKDAFDDLDKDKSGALDMIEWKAFGKVVFRLQEKERTKDESVRYEEFAIGEIVVDKDEVDRHHKKPLQPNDTDIDKFVSDAFKHVDANHDGKVSFKEFQDYLVEVNRDLVGHTVQRALENPASAIALREAFDVLDSDQNGKLDQNEFQIFGQEVFKSDKIPKLTKEGHTPTAADVKTFVSTMWTEVDRNHDGYMSWTEFLEWFEKRYDRQYHHHHHHHGKSSDDKEKGHQRKASDDKPSDDKAGGRPRKQSDDKGTGRPRKQSDDKGTGHERKVSDDKEKK
jgi:Ca2+-binding EF-hand superfamily protein